MLNVIYNKLPTQSKSTTTTTCPNPQSPTLPFPQSRNPLSDNFDLTRHYIPMFWSSHKSQSKAVIPSQEKKLGRNLPLNPAYGTTETTRPIGKQRCRCSHLHIIPAHAKPAIGWKTRSFQRKMRRKAFTRSRLSVAPHSTAPKSAQARAGSNRSELHAQGMSFVRLLPGA